MFISVLNPLFWVYAVMCRFSSQILIKMKKLETISEIKLKLKLGEKLNCSESHIVLNELKGDKYINLLLKQKENLLIIMEKINKARKDSVSAMNGGSGSGFSAFRSPKF